MEPLDAILHSYVASGEDTRDKILGAAIAVVNKDDCLRLEGTLYEGSAGRIDLDVNSHKFGLDSFTWVASLTKIITITCLMQLVERKAIELDDDLRSLLPELGKLQILRGFDEAEKPILQDNTRPITLRHLLTHTLGIGVDMADPDLVKWSKAVGRTANYLDFSKEGFNTPLKFAPGDGWYYGTAIDWAGQVLEKVTGQSLGAYMQEHIFEPLGIQDTTFWPGRVPQASQRTIAYAYRKDGILESGPKPTPEQHEVECGGAGLYSTAADYALFLSAFLQGKLLREETVKQMFTPQLNEAQGGILEMLAYNVGIQDALAPEFPKGLKLNHGIGGVMNMEDVPGKRRKGSLMWSGACNSRWWMDLQTGIAAVMIVNIQPHGDPVVKQLYDELERAVYLHLVKVRN
ncbi:Beta-lactamase [Paramyrothecium foliicola]|nr:Beta-lactamase [Paramyrothecium foliicola]